MDYAFCFMMMVTTCIVHSGLQCSLKAAVRRFTSRGRIAAVENDDHSNIIEGKSLSKQCFSFKHAGRKPKFVFNLINHHLLYALSYEYFGLIYTIDDVFLYE